jgi:phage gp29-like protein
MAKDDIKGLIDQFGRPMPRAQIAQLGEEISEIRAIKGRPPFQTDGVFGMTPDRLGAVMRAADNGSTLEWQIVAGQVELMFTHYQAVLGKRRRSIVQQPITVTAASDDPAHIEHANFVRDWIATETLQRALFDMTDAIGRGYSVSEILWETKPGCVRPKTILFREARHFEVSWEDGETLWLRDAGGFVDLAPHKFIVHRHKSLSGLLMRSGLHRSIAMLWLFGQYTQRDWTLFVQGYGLPIRLGKYGPAASDTDKAVLRRAVFSIAGDVAAIIPDSMSMEFIKDTDRAAGAKLYEARMDWFNREASKLVLGSTAGVEAIAGGHAVGQEHRASEQDVVKFDSALLCATLIPQVIETMIAWTFGPQAKYPALQIGQPDQVPLKDVIAGVADLAGAGLKVKASEIRDRLGLTQPEPGDETIGGIPPAPEPKPDIPSLAVTPPVSPQTQGWLSPLFIRHTEAPPEVVAQLTQRLAADAAGAMAGLTDQVRHVIETASDMHDLVHRMHALQLDPKEFAEAMARGMALANLVGQAALVQELKGAR